jgi:hypothetical protein
MVIKLNIMLLPFCTAAEILFFSLYNPKLNKNEVQFII